MAEQAPITKERRVELSTRRLGCAINLNSWVANVSSSRLHMFAGHLGQMLVVSNPTRPKNVTGVEREYGTYVWNHRTDSEIRVVRVIPRFGISGNDRDSIQHSPSKLLVFERSGNREIGCMEITDTVQKHQYFGYFLKPQPVLSRLNIGDIIPEDTILSQSPNVNEVGDWRPGRESPVVFMSLPQVIEDGVVACKEDMEYFKHWRFSNVVMQADGLWVPLNLYGTEDRYQPFPDIGDRIRSDGLIFALRKWDPDTAFVRLTPKALMRFDNAFDRGTYGKPGAIVTNVDIWWGGEFRHWQDRLPVGMERQFMKYENRNRAYAKMIVDTYTELSRQAGGELNISPDFSRLVYESYMRLKHNKRRINYVYKRAQVPDWRVSLTYAYERTPTIGDKFTGTDGDKGVLVDLWPAADMPVDEYGIRASFIMDGDSTIKRMNPSRVFKQYVNTASWHVQRKVIQLMAEGKRAEAWDWLSGYWQLAYPEHWQLMTEFIASRPTADEGIDVCLGAACEWDEANGEFLTHFLPPDSVVIGIEQIRRIFHSRYRPIATQLTFRGRSGNIRKTVNKFFVGSIYMLILEKVADDAWSSVSSPKTQHLGIPAKQSRVDKLSDPGNNTPVRILGEDEIRLLTNTLHTGDATGGEIVAEILNITNNPQAHRLAMRRIMTAENPAQISGRIVDPKEVPTNCSRPVNYSNHLIGCMGGQFRRHKYRVKPRG